MAKEPTQKGTWRKKLHKVISWSSANADSIKSAVVGVTDSGGAILFSATRDGGALVLSVYSGEETAKEYVTEQGDISALLQWVVETYA